MAVLSALLFVSCDKDKTEPDTMPMSGNANITFENVVKPKKYVQSGIFKGNGKINEGGREIGNLILPSDDKMTNSTKIKFNAGKGQRLMFAMMFGASKDWFFAARQPGIPLYDDNGKARTGNIVSEISLWDNGSKNDDTGAKEDNNITSLFARTMPRELMSLMLDYDEKTSEFTLTITNTSKGKKDVNGKSLETPFSPGVWVVSNVVGGKLLDEKPFFEANKKTTPELSMLAEMGNPDPLYKKIQAETGIITGLSPAIVVVYKGNKNPLFEVGKKDAGQGLKEVSQMGNFEKLQASLKKDANVKAFYLAGNAPVAPSEKVSANIKLEQGDKIAYAFMFGYSNDWFYANEAEIMATERGELTSKTVLFDNGTGFDQYPGAGNRQALFGGMPEKEDNAIQRVGGQFPVPNVSEVVKVTLK
ncbi:spondin domain-containing protein [Capnocytophaga sp.]|uniref:spondin domain-containing protein n=1 Tax=Capnocytophaga sp. TaxID=44737 RepID=UPI0026DC1E41|nr:spondin domain-containing protein [Capnocytophaga sp.]MDO5105209.1 spondin domain-containing protein [Capnocytophaga sp.]